MAIYTQQLQTLAKLCAKCGGRCCIDEANITISKHELASLKKILDFDVGSLESPSGKINTIKIQKKRYCPFIDRFDTKKGCILKGSKRPLSCRLFPLTYLIEEDEPVFYISKHCPEYKAAMKLDSWIAKTINTAKAELDTWTAEEKLTRSYHHEKIHEGKKLLIGVHSALV